MADERQMICDRCRRAVPISDMKYMPKGDGGRIGLCSACRAKFNPEEEIKKEAKKAIGSKKQYFCTRCRYKFTYDPKSITNLKCPYCGKEDHVIEHKMQSADKLLKNLTE
jgi:DNA-directed RNA polymerase subunit RPC12/RpoP